MNVGVHHPEGFETSPFMRMGFDPFRNMVSNEINFFALNILREFHGEAHDSLVPMFPVHNSRIAQESGIRGSRALSSDSLSQSGFIQINIFNYPSARWRSIANVAFGSFGDEANSIANSIRLLRENSNDSLSKWSNISQSPIEDVSTLCSNYEKITYIQIFCTNIIHEHKACCSNQYSQDESAHFYSNYTGCQNECNCVKEIIDQVLNWWWINEN